jgi:hypothetical protein
MGKDTDIKRAIANSLAYGFSEEMKDLETKFAIWLHTTAINPDKLHLTYVGKKYRLDKGIGGVVPGERYGCQCGAELVVNTDDYKDMNTKQLMVYLSDAPKNVKNAVKQEMDSDTYSYVRDIERNQTQYYIVVKNKKLEVNYYLYIDDKTTRKFLEYPYDGNSGYVSIKEFEKIEKNVYNYILKAENTNQFNIIDIGGVIL